MKLALGGTESNAVDNQPLQLKRVSDFAETVLRATFLVPVRVERSCRHRAANRQAEGEIRIVARSA